MEHYESASAGVGEHGGLVREATLAMADRPLLIGSVRLFSKVLLLLGNRRRPLGERVFQSGRDTSDPARSCQLCS